MVRVRTANDVLLAKAKPGKAMPERDCDCTVEELLPLLAQSKSGVKATKGGEAVGVVTASSVIAALAADRGSHSEGAACWPTHRSGCFGWGLCP